EKHVGMGEDVKNVCFGLSAPNAGDLLQTCAGDLLHDIYEGDLLQPRAGPVLAALVSCGFENREIDWQALFINAQVKYHHISAQIEYHPKLSTAI
ncbi:hypothetical protein STEG23_022668, partial [Scotinomys teguina]